MYIYLSKKISMPNNTIVTACSWNREQGCVAAGGVDGMVKVIKLEMTEGKDPKGNSGQTNLVMNQTLEGHKGSIACIAWNDQFDKLTTADNNGMIIVWINHEGSWYEEMINNRNKSVVKSMKWNSDGQQICIVYEDGAIIVGSVEGTRIWSKELKNTHLTQVEWSPDSRLLLFGLINGEVQIFDSNGDFISKLNVACLDGGAQIVSIDWYDGRNGFVSADSPALAICYSNGRCQIMAHEADEKPILLSCQMDVVCAQWNHDGSVLAIAGMQSQEEKLINMVQFYNPWGQHLKTLKVPGKKISACCWEGGSLRIAITIDSFIYFANLRPDYKWCYFNNTIVYGYNKPGKVEQCVMFYDLKTAECYLKFVKQLYSIIAGGDYCSLISRTEDVFQNTVDISNNGNLNYRKNSAYQHILVLCNSIGTPLETKYIDIEPLYSCMTSSHVIIASKSYFYIWNYQVFVDYSSIKKQTNERLSFIDNPNVSLLKNSDDELAKNMSIFEETPNPMTSIVASDKFLFIGREAGSIDKFSLMSGSLVETYNLEIIPFKLSVNCTSSRLAIIDSNSTMKILDVDAKQQKVEHATFKRTDVWSIVWASDNPDMFVSMEKTKMYIFRDTEPEEPTSCAGYICSFADLQVKAVLLDNIMKRPENPEFTDIVYFDTKSLRDTRELLEGVNLQDACQFIEHNPHQKLWRLLAEAALNKFDFKTAEHAYVKCKDYFGLEFVKKLQTLTNPSLKKGELSAYFSLFDEAELVYLEADRKDLAIQLRRKLGDWFKVLQLLKNGSLTPAEINAESDVIVIANSLSTGSDLQLEEAYNEIGDYYSERQKWSQAVQYYLHGSNHAKLAESYYILEDYDCLTKLLDQLPDNSDILPKIALMFESVGMCNQACQAYLKVNNIKMAVDTCVKLNQWDEGVRLAKQYNINQVDQLLAKQANILLQQNKVFNAIELYRKARHYLDAAKLMMDVADKEAKQRNSPLLIKKLYVLAGLLVEQYHDMMKTGSIISAKSKTQTSKALEGLLNEESQAAINDSKLLDNAWRGAEAYHFLMLTQRQLRSGNIEAAFKTSLSLMEYEDILETKHIYSLIALCACGNGSYNAASKAFIKLESSHLINAKDRKDFETLAFQIFSINPPKDKKPSLKGECPQCGHQIIEWCTNCPNCDTRFPPCIVSGRPILEPQFRVCTSCKHRAIESEMENRVSCPLCHFSVK